MRLIFAVTLTALFLGMPTLAQRPTVEDLLEGRVRVALPVSDASVSWLSERVYRRTDTATGKSAAYDARTGREVEAPASVPDESGAGFALQRGQRGGASLISPDGRFRAEVRGGNLYLSESGGPPRQLTSDGSATILNGLLDWVYEEEIYGRGSRYAVRWSPDSRKIAFLRLDTSAVKPFTLIDVLPRLQDIEVYGYPLPGDPNPTATLAIADVAAGSAPVFLDTSMYPADDRLIVRFGFSPDSRRVLWQVQNREQTFLDLWSADATTGGNAKKLIHEEAKSGWVDVTDDPTWLKDGTFLWASERTGFKHLYRYGVNGLLMNPVTRGNWDVGKILRTDEARGEIFFDANEKSVSGAYVWRARLDGSGEPLCLTPEPGTHRASFSPGGEFFFDAFSDATTPGKTVLRDRDGKVLRTLSESRLPTGGGVPPMGIAKFYTFAARDGYKLEGTLLLPPDWTPGTRVPVLCPVYAGPSAPSARNNWISVNASASDQFYARNGIAVWRCDNRSANPRGTAAKFSIYKNMGASELRDIEDGLDFLIKEGIADEKRIGISGWSYGGFMSAYALTHSKKFAVGVAGAPPTDWRLYDTIYTERYMSTPQKNPAGYESSSCVLAAARLSGSLMIVHGMMDDNVHVQNSIQLVHALQKAGKDFELCLYPGKSSRHGIGDRDLSRHQRRRAAEFLLSRLAQ